MSYLVLRNLTKNFGAHTAVDNLSLSIEAGEFVSLLGPSGCGKTTTLQMIAGFVEPSSGTIELANNDLVAMDPRDRSLGVVFQSYALFPHMTVFENVSFGLEMRNVTAEERKSRVAEILDLVGLGAMASRYPRQMSGGQQQRVALARALAIRPRILLLDEPLSNLDAKLREGMQLELRQIQRRLGTTTVLVTHDQSEALALSDRIVVMNGGRVEQCGRPEDIYERPATPFVANFLGKTNMFAGVAADRSRIEVGDGSWAVADRVAPGPVLCSIRPEKIRFVPGADNGLAGTMRSRIFQGTHWLCEVETAAGVAIVIRQNDGTSCPREGETVKLGWTSGDMAVTGGTA